MAEPLIGQILGNYRVEELLGTGGMGQVFRGVHIHLGRAAAVKVMHEHLAIDPAFQARFLQEARAVASLTHPHVVQIYDFGIEDNRSFLVMEIVADGSLRTLIGRAGSRQTLDLLTGLEFLRQSADGLGYAHRLGMVHRDVKPENLLLKTLPDTRPEQPSSMVKVGDFGLARLVDSQTLTLSGVMLGTPAYMSPEQCQGLSVDARSDIYALGVVLYEVATGAPLFEVKTPSEAIFKHVFVEPPLPRDIRPGLPPGVEAIILRCLSKQPADRYADGSDLARDLARVMDQLTPGRVRTQPQDLPSSLDTTDPVPRMASPEEPASHAAATPALPVGAGLVGGAGIRTVAVTPAPAPVPSAATSPVGSAGRVSNDEAGTATHATVAQGTQRPPWVIPAVLIALVALIGSAGLFVWMNNRETDTKPTITSVTIDPPQPVLGAPVTIRWDVNDATRIDIEPLVDGLDPSIGSYRFEDGIGDGMTLTLVATNAAGSSERQLLVALATVPADPSATGDLPTGTAGVADGPAGSSPLSASQEPTTADGLSVVEQGFGQPPDKAEIGWAFVIENPSQELAITSSVFRIFAYDAAGTVLADTSGSVALVLPGQRLGIAGRLELPEETTADTIDIQLLAGPTTTTTDEMPVVISQIAFDRDDAYLESVTALLANQYDDPLDALDISVVAYDAGGHIIGGGDDSVSFVPGGGVIGVEALLVASSVPARVDVYAAVTNPNLFVEDAVGPSGQDVTLVSSGFGSYRSPSTVGFAFIVENPNPTLGVEFTRYQYTLFDAAGAVVHADDGRIDALLPGERLGIADWGVLSAGVSRFEVHLHTGTFVEATVQRVVTVQDVAFVEEELFITVTATAANASDSHLSSAYVYAVALNAAGEIVGGGRGFVAAPGNGTDNVTLDSVVATSPVARIELYVPVDSAD